MYFDTGLEYTATKKHLEFLENKYDIKIHRERAIKPIPTVCRQIGQPFLSKFVSQQIELLQKNNFKWENESFEALEKKYPKCTSAIKWWTNQYTKDNDFEKVSRYDIGYNRHLKEFILENPPEFHISSKCCKYSKKDIAKKIVKEMKCDLDITGVRRAEGGIRAQAYKNCYTSDSGKVDTYRPIFWFTNESKRKYEQAFGIVHSELYRKHNFTRTGCCCCPYGGKSLEHELDITKKIDPMLYKAVCNVFKDSFEYTRKFYKFRAEKKAVEKGEILENQVNLFEIVEEDE